MDADELIRLLRQKVKEEGGYLKFAEKHQISQGYLSNVLCGINKPGPKIAHALGLKRRWNYEPQ